jgi:hypothetical protein
MSVEDVVQEVDAALSFLFEGVSAVNAALALKQTKIASGTAAPPSSGNPGDIYLRYSP